MKNHVKITLKSWSETRWESRVNRVEAIRYQTSQVREALLKVKEKSAGSALKIEAQSLAEESGSFRFCICSIVWYDILNRIENVSKLMQSVSMQLDMAVDLLGKTKPFLTQYRGNGFASAQALAREMCEDMNVEAVLKEKRLRSTRKQFSYECPDEPISDALKRMENYFFNVVVDVAIVSLEKRFKTMGEVKEKFGVLVNFPKMTNEELVQQCETLSTTLSNGEQSDIDGKQFLLEMRSFPDLPSTNMTTMEILQYLHDKRLQ